MGSAAIACFLAREGADIYAKAGTGVSALELCFEEVTGHFARYAEARSTFYGSLRKSPKPTSAELAERSA